MAPSPLQRLGWATSKFDSPSQALRPFDSEQYPAQIAEMPPYSGIQAPRTAHDDDPGRTAGGKTTAS